MKASKSSQVYPVGQGDEIVKDWKDFLKQHIISEAQYMPGTVLGSWVISVSKTF